MSKRIKIEAIIDVEDTLHIDDVLLKRTISSIGEVHSCKINSNFEGRVLSINLKDNEKGLFGWVYDIMIIDINNKIKQVRVDAGTSTVLSVVSGE